MDTAAVWFSGVSALAAVGALIWAVITTRQQIAILRREEAQREQERDHRDEAEERRAWQTYRAQAEQVAAVIHVDSKAFRPYAFEGDDLKQQIRHHSWVKVANASSQPIYDVSVELRATDSDKRYKETATLVLPGQTGHLHLPAMADRDLHETPIGVRFRDNGGRQWLREGTDQLFEVDDDGSLWQHHGDGRHRTDDPNAHHDH